MSDLLLDCPLPLVAAPMAGGPTTVALASAVARAGAFPFLAGGYKTPDDLSAEIDQVRSTGAAFGVNLFVPSARAVDEVAFASYAKELAVEAAVYGLELNPIPAIDDDHWEAKLALLTSDPAPVVSFTFGLAEQSVINALQSVGTRVLSTVTNVHEALLARNVGVDGLIVQGQAAGGHSAVFDPSHTPAPATTPELVRTIVQATELPVIGAGGVDGPGAVRQILAAGAQAAAVGTMLLRTDEAGTSPTHRQALADPAFSETVLTRAFTGGPARALLNGFAHRHPNAPDAYPAVHHLTRPLRQAAARAGDTDRLHLWAGTGWRNAPVGPATEVIQHLIERL